MENNIELSIIRLFSKDSARELTINQISKELKKSYSFVNKEVRDLIGKGILNKKIIGPSIVCSLNAKNDRTIMLLSMVSVDDKERFFAEKAKALEAIRIPSEKITQQASVYTIYINRKDTSKVTVVCDDWLKVRGVLTGIDTPVSFTVIGKESFGKDKDNRDIVVTFGFENYWRLQLR